MLALCNMLIILHQLFFKEFVFTKVLVVKLVCVPGGLLLSLVGVYYLENI